jgi:hypothetical protein
VSPTKLSSSSFNWLILEILIDSFLPVTIFLTLSNVKEALVKFAIFANFSWSFDLKLYTF